LCHQNADNKVVKPTLRSHCATLYCLLWCRLLYKLFYRMQEKYESSYPQ
jgi:hypothetical protein